MYRIRFLLTRMDGGSSNDDKILVETVEDETDIFRVIYSTPEYSRKKTFLATKARVLDYLEDIVYSLWRDTDPFSHIQVTTSIHPCVMYQVPDLYEKDVRDLILNMCKDALRVNVRNQ